MFLPIFIYTGIAVLFSILQSNVFGIWAIMTVQPDLSYIVLVYFSFMYGAMPGQICGFVDGLVFDFMSTAPFGFNALMRTVCGTVIGRFKGAILLDNILLPMALVAVSLLFKAAALLLIAPITNQGAVLAHQFSAMGLIEFLFTIIVAPLLFWPLRILHNALQSRRAYR